MWINNTLQNIVVIFSALPHFKVRVPLMVIQILLNIFKKCKNNVINKGRMSDVMIQKFNKVVPVIQTKTFKHMAHHLWPLSKNQHDICVRKQNHYQQLIRWQTECLEHDQHIIRSNFSRSTWFVVVFATSENVYLSWELGSPCTVNSHFRC